MIDLRQHQIEATQKLRQSILSGHKRPILFAPCAFGKTICAANIADSAITKGNKTLFIVHRRLLAEQTKEKFDLYGLHSSIIMAGYETDFAAPVMITTHQTYSRRLQLDSPQINQFFHDATIVIVDECHLGISPSYKKIYKYYIDKIIIGLTGSPSRADQRGLGEVFDDLVESISIQDLTNMGYLTPARYFTVGDVDLSGVKITAGDYNRGQLQKRMNTKKLNGGVLENWLRLSEGRQTIVFTTGVRHSIALQKEFERAAIKAAHLDAHSDDDERERVLNQFRDGDITVVTNCRLFTEGYDADFASCIVLAMSTKSYPLYVQMVGRGQRIYPGKEDFLVLDHGNNIKRFGFISDPVSWSLDGKKKAWSKSKQNKKEPQPIECTICGAVFKSLHRCPNCGKDVETFGKKIECTDDELKELRPSKKKEYTMEDKKRWWGMLEYYRREKGYAQGWLSHNFKSKFGTWPKALSDSAIVKPDKEVKNYITYQNIKFAKRRIA